MSWLSGGELHSGAWTSSNYAGLGILFESLPTTGENGGSPLLNDGGVNGDEVRWELLTASGVTMLEFNEDGSFASDGIGSFTYRSYINNAAVVPDFTVSVISYGAPVSVDVSVNMPQMTVAAQSQIAQKYDVDISISMPQMLVKVNRELDSFIDARAHYKMPQMQMSASVRVNHGRTIGTFIQPTSANVTKALN